jgi:hypothetical protein
MAPPSHWLLIQDPASVNNGRLQFCDGTILCPEFRGW